MPQNRSNIVRIGKETPGARGTAVAGTLTVPIVGDGCKIGLTNHLGQIRASSTWPSMTDQVSLGLTPVVRLAPDVNLATIRDIILMCLMRTSGALPEFTIEETIVEQQKAAGCVCRSLEMQFSRSENPDAAALLSAQMEFAAMSRATATGITAGTYGTGHRFPIAKATFTLNSVAALEVLSFSWRASNSLGIGPHDATGKILYIEDGDEEHSFSLTARFAAATWRALVAAGTENACTFLIATGTTNETVTLTCGKCQINSHELQGGDIVTEQITVTPHHTGAARPVVPTFGSAIGASGLTLA